MADNSAIPVLELSKVCKSFAKASGDPVPVLADIDVTLREGEILGLLGRSGSGKSTLLRIAGGLVSPTSGAVRYRGDALSGPAPGIAVVFQTFALYPWLTVLQNVELGLDALKLPATEGLAKAVAAIDLIGLDGFQSAYPRELSGGMRQRVGFARALVSDPILLLMDEPFSELDVLTADTLRTDFLDLWVEHQLSTKAVLMVTHNIDEAVLMCDRILVLLSHPGRIAAEIPVPLAHPRDRLDSEFRSIVDDIYAILTARLTESAQTRHALHGGVAQPLPHVSTNRIGGFVETVASPPYLGCAELAELGRKLALEVNELLPVAEALHVLEFADVKDGRVRLTAAGRVYAHSGTDDRKRQFREHLLRFVPLAAHIRRVLDDRESHTAPRARFDFELQDHLSKDDARRTLNTAIGWARYAELFSYDDRARQFTLAR